MLGFAHLLGGYGALDLARLPVPGLAEHGQQHDPTSRSKPIGDPPGSPTQMEAQLANRALKMLLYGSPSVVGEAASLSA